MKLAIAPRSLPDGVPAALAARGGLAAAACGGPGVGRRTTMASGSRLGEAASWAGFRAAGRGGAEPAAVCLLLGAGSISDGGLGFCKYSAVLWVFGDASLAGGEKKGTD